MNVLILLCNSYIMGCPPVCVCVQVDNHGITIFIPPSSVYIVYLTHHEIFHAKVVKGGVI